MKIFTGKAEFGKNYSPGFIAFTVRRHDFIAQGISWFERWDSMSRFPTPTHTFIITGEDSTVEAFGDGVHEGTLSAYLQDKDVALIVRKPRGWTPDLGARIVAAGKAMVGQKYGYCLIAAMAVSNSWPGKLLSGMTSGWFGRFVQRLGDSKKTAICSEVVFEAMARQPEFNDCRIAKDCDIPNPAQLFFNQELFERHATELMP